ncbi:MAG: tRNA (adenosine(37)-N6)-dimethylallyltransferase MiaA [Bacteroidia bacterium]
MNTLLVITGPTAIGKTGLAIKLAQELKTEILSADSRQFYKEMSIGTAKPSPEELATIPHHFVGHISIHQDYDAGKFEAEAIDLLTKLFKQQKTIILCGGSGMYVDAICKGFDPLPEAGEEYRLELIELHKTKGIVALQKMLLEKDPEYHKMVDLHNPQRLIRALEICLATGLPYSGFRKGKVQQRDFRIVKVGLNTDRDTLYKQINKRVEDMMKAGLLKEAEGLLSYRNLQALQTVGYRELFDYLDGKIDLTTATGYIKQNTRNFAKRQLTWFRRDQEINWFDPIKDKEVTGKILELIKTV